MTNILGNFGPTNVDDRWETVTWTWDVAHHHDTVFTREDWPAGDFICNSAGTRVIVQNGEARILKPEEALKLSKTTGWKLYGAPDLQERRRWAIHEAIKRFHAELEEYSTSPKAKADLGHEYRIVITLKDIRDMDHAWSVMESLHLDGGNIEGAVVEMAERWQYPPRQEGEE